MSKNILLILVVICLILSLKHAFSAQSIQSTQPTKSKVTNKPNNTKQSGKIDPKAAFSKDEYSLYKSTYLGRAGKVKKLVDSGVNVNVHSPNSQRTPLHIAASRGKIEIVKTLVDGGANLELTNLEGKTPLYFAIESSRTEIIKYLHSKGAKITQEMINCASANIKQILASLK